MIRFMSYRDDLAAAHARITALEAELEHREDVTQTARDDREAAWNTERWKLLGEISDLRSKLAEAEAIIDELRARMPSEPAEGELLSLFDHNLGFAPLTTGTVAAVACPQCGAEMHRLDDSVLRFGDAEAVEVGCPRCLFASRLRKR